MGLNLFEKISRIKQAYENSSIKFKPKDEGQGFWRQTPIDVVDLEVKLYRILEHKGTFKPQKILLAGSGDGRRAALLNTVGYDDITAIEINPILADYSNEIIKKLAKENVVDNKKIKIVQGSFLENKLYETQGLEFSDFDTVSVFLLPKNLQLLVDKIEKESKQGTILSYLTFSDFKDPYFSSMEKIFDRCIGEIPMARLYLTIYQKN